MIPDAIVMVDVAPSRLSNGPKRSPPTSGIHPAVYPSRSSSFADAAASAWSPKRSSPDQTPVPRKVMTRTLAKVVDVHDTARRHWRHLGRAHPAHEERALTPAGRADHVQPGDLGVVPHDRDPELAAGAE